MNRRASGLIAATIVLAALSASCNRGSVSANSAAPAAAATSVTVGVAKAEIRPISQQLTISSELVPFEEIDVYAKESGYVRDLRVDYGSHVHKGEIMAVLEIPELEALLQQDRASISQQEGEVTRAEHDVSRSQAQHNVSRLQFERLEGVSKTQPGLVAQQEVDDAQGKDLASEAQVESSQAALAAAKSQLAVSQAKLTHDQALFDYSKITAPFDGVVTQRYANLGALMQAGTTSTQATPLVRLSEENVFRLVIPVPESDVRYIYVGNPVQVRVPALDKVFQGKVARFSVDVNGSTRTMHTEVDIPNSDSRLVPGLYAEAMLTLNQKPSALSIPQQALNREGDKASVFVVTPDDHIENRPVTLGVQAPDFAEVASGLRAGENVVVSDRSGLKAGETVQPKLVETLSWEGKNQ